MPNPRGSETLPERLEWLRHQTGFQQQEFAAAIGASKAAYSNWIYEQSRPTVPTLLTIHETYGIGPDFLLLGLTGNLSPEWRQRWELRL